jgi:tRNA A-37 threonylcarbamoyl transferase component Bud32
MEIVNIKGKDYQIIRLLGHGKGGYSYLVEYEGRKAVLKQIHHEPCDYYQFGNKIEAEINDYRRLKEAGIRIPEMLDLDIEKERIVKEYVEGDTIFDLVRNDIPTQRYIEQVREMAKTAKEAGLNIDYFPTNFIVQDETIWYIDYECNSYCEEWNFENWGIRYWSKTPEFEDYLAKRDDQKFLEKEEADHAG